MLTEVKQTDTQSGDTATPPWSGYPASMTRARGDRIIPQRDLPLFLIVGLAVTASGPE